MKNADEKTVTLDLFLDKNIKKRASILASERKISLGRLFEQLIEAEDKRVEATSK